MDAVGASNTIGLIGGFSLCLRSLDFQGDPAFQNCAAFISVTVGVIGAIILGFDVSSVLLKDELLRGTKVPPSTRWGRSWGQGLRAL